jgi:hypothetical protein
MASTVPKVRISTTIGAVAARVIRTGTGARLSEPGLPSFLEEQPPNSRRKDRSETETGMAESVFMSGEDI